MGSDLLRSPAAHQQMQSHPIAILATQQLPDGSLQKLPLDIPQRDVDGADRTAQYGAAEWSHAVEVLPMPLDLARIFSDQILTKRLYYCVDGRWVGPARGLPEPDEPVLGGDADKVCAAEHERLDLGELHKVCSSTSDDGLLNLDFGVGKYACNVRRSHYRGVTVEEARRGAVLIRHEQRRRALPAHVHHRRAA